MRKYDLERRWGTDNGRGALLGGALGFLLWAGVVAVILWIAL